MTNINTEAQTAADKQPNPTQAGKHAAATGAQVGRNASPTVGAEASKAAATLADDARALASQARTSAQDRMKTEVEKRSSQGADELSEIARAFHQSGKDLEGNIAGPYVQKAAEKIEHVSHYMRTARPGEVVESVASFAKRDPVLFLSGAFAVGLFSARFLKSGGASQTSGVPSTQTFSQGRASDAAPH